MDIKRLDEQREYTISHLPQVQQILHEGLGKNELTHHEFAVISDLRNTLNWERALSQKSHNLLQEEDYREKWSAHLMTDCRRV